MSRYDLFRRRLAPIAFGVAIVLLARESCNAEKRTHATLILELGTGSKAVEVEAKLLADGDEVGEFHADATGKPELTFDMSVPNDSGDGEIVIDLTLAGGKHVTTTRHFRAAEASRVTIPLLDLTH